MHGITNICSSRKNDVARCCEASRASNACVAHAFSHRGMGQQGAGFFFVHFDFFQVGLNFRHLRFELTLVRRQHHQKPSRGRRNANQNRNADRVPPFTQREASHRLYFHRSIFRRTRFQPCIRQRGGTGARNTQTPFIAPPRMDPHGASNGPCYVTRM